MKPLNEIVREQTGNVYEKYTDVGFAGVLLQAIIKELESKPRGENWPDTPLEKVISIKELQKIMDTAEEVVNKLKEKKI